MSHPLRFSVGMLAMPLALLLVPIAFAGSVSVPNTFTAGTPAVAAEVNANFAAVEAAINDNDARLASVEGTSIVHVNAIPGDNAASGTALRDALAAATGGTLIRLSPGTFDIGATTLFLKADVDLCGAGRDRTFISTSTATPLVDHTDTGRRTLTDLTLESTNPALSTVLDDGPGEVVLKCCRLRLDSPMGGEIARASAPLIATDTEILGSGHNLGRAIAGVVCTDTPQNAELHSCLIEIVGDGSATGCANEQGDTHLTMTACQIRLTSHLGGASGVLCTRGNARAQLHGCQVTASTALQVSEGSARIEAGSCMIAGSLSVGIPNAAIKLVGCYDGGFAALADQ